MAAPTAIPHAENSSHQQQHHARSNSPPLISPPVYSRTAFSLPGGPIVSPSTSSSFRNTANGWTTTGVGSSSPPRGAQRDKFPERRPSNVTTANNNNTPSIARHSRAFSTSSATSANSLSSSTSSIDSFGGPHTPRQSTNGGSTDTGSIAASLGGAPLGRVPSIPLATSPYEAIKTGRRDSWATPTSPPQQSTWGGFNTLRSGRSPPAHQDSFGSGNDLFRTKSRDSAQQQQASATTSTASGGMTGLFRKLSMGTASRPSAQPPSSQSHTHHHGHHHHHGHRSASISAVETPTITTTSPAPATTSAADAPPSPTRGRQASLSAGGAGGGTRRRPSPHGERLLMGWTHAH